jgi:hypothetical protein
MSGCEPSDEVKSIIRQMAKAKLEEGLTHHEDIVDAIHTAIHDHTPLGKSEIADVISGYGQKKAERAPTKTELQARMQQLKRDLKEAYHPKPAKPTPEQSRNAQRQAQIKKQIAEIQDRIARKDFSKPERTGPEYDETTKELQRLLDRARAKADFEVAKQAHQAKSTAAKTAAWFIALHRAALLSNPLTIAKLGGAAAWHMLFSPIEDLVGHAAAKIPLVSRVAAASPLHNDISTLAGIRAGYARAFSKQTLKDIADKWRTGQSDLQVQMKDARYDPHPYFDFINRLHNIMKTPAENYAFGRSLLHATEYTRTALAKAGKSPAEIDEVLGRESTKTALATQAYVESARAKLQDKHWISEGMQRALSGIEDRTPMGGIIKGIADYEMPVKTVPVNAFSQATSYALGFSKAILGIMKAARSKEGMTPEMADQIMRNIKKGAVGKALLAIGVVGASALGGLWDPNDYKNKGKGDYGSVTIGGHEIPHWLLHSPAWDTIQMAATATRAFNADLARSRKKESDSEQPVTDMQRASDYVHAAEQGVLRGGEAELASLPLVDTPMEIWKALSSGDGLNKFLGKNVAENVPQIVQEAAKRTDPEQALKRRPQNAVQEVEAAIPGLRERVPLAKLKGMPLDDKLDAYDKMTPAEREKTGIVDSIMSTAEHSRSITPDQQKRLDAIQ